MLATAITKSPPVPEGWILLNTTTSAKWHFRDATGWCLCERSSPYPPKAVEWRPEPTGRRDVCPNCRRHLAKREREEKLYEAVKAEIAATPIPSVEPEVLEVPAPVDDAPAAPVLPIAPAPTPIESEPMPAAKPQLAVNDRMLRIKKAPVAKKEPVIPTAPDVSLQSAYTFAKINKFDYKRFHRFLDEVMPWLPRMQTVARQPQIILDRAAQERAKREFPLWGKAPEAPTATGGVSEHRLARLETDVAAMRTMLEAILRELKVQV